MNTAKQRIVANFETVEGTFYEVFCKKDVFDTEKYFQFLEDVHAVTNEWAGKPLDRELAVCLNGILTYLLESCIYHERAADMYEVANYPEPVHMSSYLEVLKEMVQCFFEGKPTEKFLLESEETPHKILLFTGAETNDPFTEEFMEFIEAQYGIEKDEMVYTRIRFNEQDGKFFYIHMVSERKEALEEMEELLQCAEITTDGQLKEWVHSMDFILLKNDGNIEEQNEYFFAL